ncbi:cation:proton antiporter [Undibacterium sp. TS12]|uniref:cation:proton antiporter n=1 Tax=Undibacterium sp. TS12 TaxID=2908202 RepID=UPI001F4CB42D|nr:cation:proton antiporter [Undibacterium sp. TS12]MCH8621931.1 cation:proton antiporter [Undibacterium sp. TS12]
MFEFFNSNLAELAWPFALVFAWLAGEFGHRWTGLPRISIYGLVGFLLANSQLGMLSHDGHSAILLLANIAFGLILFEFGYRINIRWLRNNPWIGLTGVLEATLTFSAVYVVATWCGTPILTALLLAALTMSTSPAGLLRVINEQRSAGQVTERILHLAAINCVMGVFTFKVIVGFWVFQNTGSLLQASVNSLLVLITSIAMGALFGVLLPLILRQLGNLGQDATVAFAFAVILLVALTHAAKLSPILATLTFGLMARHRRITLSRTQRNFGPLGDLLTVMLFVYAASTLEWQKIISGAGLGLALVAVRFAAKLSVTSLLAHISGIQTRKGVMTGLALAPISVFVILTLEQTRYLGISFADELTALAAMTLLLEIVGPILTQRALIWAKEVPEQEGK